MHEHFGIADGLSSGPANHKWNILCETMVL